MSIVVRLISIYLFFGVLLASFIAAYAVAKGNNRTNRLFAALSLLVGIFLFGYLVELNSDTLSQMIFWNQVQYFGPPYYPTFWLLLAMTYTERRPKRHRSIKTAFFFVAPTLVTIFRFTNNWHSLYYRSMTLHHTGGFPVMLLEKGPLYIFNWLYLGLYLLYSTYLYLGSRITAKGTKKGHYLILVSSIMPYFGLTLILLNPGNTGLDFTALMMPVSMVILTIALFKYDFLDVHSLARDVVFEKGKDALVLLDAQHVVKDSNQLAKVIFPELKADVIGHRIEDLIGHRHELLTTLQSLDLAENTFQINIHEIFFEVQITRLVGNSGSLSGILVSLSDITEKRRFQEKLKILAAKDGLTGLNNRANFMELAELALKQAELLGQPCSLYMLDIDHFKKTNDTYGHAAGDLILTVLSEKMRNYFRVNDILGRLGGEEFAIFLPGASIAHSEAVVDRFRAELAQTPIIFGD